MENEITRIYNIQEIEAVAKARGGFNADRLEDDFKYIAKKEHEGYDVVSSKYSEDGHLPEVRVVLTKCPIS